MSRLPLKGSYRVTVSEDAIAQYPNALDDCRHSLCRQVNEELIYQIIDTPRHVEAKLEVCHDAGSQCVELHLSVVARDDAANDLLLDSLRAEIVNLEALRDELLRENANQREAYSRMTGFLLGIDAKEPTTMSGDDREDERWDCHEHREELCVSNQGTVYHIPQGQLGWWEVHYNHFLFHPIRFKDRSAAFKWCRSGCIAELQESLGTLQVGFSTECFKLR